MPTVEELRKNNDEYQKRRYEERSKERQERYAELSEEFNHKFLRKINIAYSKLSDLSKGGSTGAVIMKENDHDKCNLMKKKRGKNEE